MKNKKKSTIIQAIILISFLLLAYGSNTIDKSLGFDNFQDKEKEVMDSWMGSTKAELILEWGTPTQTTSDGQGGEILIYDRTVAFPQTPGQVYTQPYDPNIYYSNPQSNVVTRSKMFYVDKNGIIYHWLCQGRQGN